MADLILSGALNLGGILNLKATAGDKVKVGHAEVLVQVNAPGDPSQGKGIPVTIPLPPTPKPIDDGPDVWIIKSFNSTVTAQGKPVVVMGICIQGTTPTWPGMVLTSSNNSTVKINQVPINVVGDSGITLPNGGSVTFSQASGQ